MEQDAYYFGCWKDKGHHLFYTDGNQVGYNQGPKGIKTQSLDGTFMPERCPLTQGIAYHSILFDKWTIINFYDNSVDGRPASHSLFLLRGVMDYETALTKAKETFPTIFNRFTFPIVKAE